jgi:hypothetical protein
MGCFQGRLTASGGSGIAGTPLGTKKYVIHLIIILKLFFIRH